MSFFTYEQGVSPRALETFEWDNTWIHSSNDGVTPRVLYIGDSISCGVRRLATEIAEDRLLFDGFGTSKAVDNPYFLDSIRLFSAQQGRRNAVIFNNGLHGWHLDDNVEYLEYYRMAVQFLTENFSNVPLYLVLTSSVENPEREARVLARNKVVLRIAAEYDLPVIDLYAVSVEYIEYRKADGVHYTEDGYRKFAGRIVEKLGENLEF